jgi:protein phosphatase
MAHQFLETVGITDSGSVRQFNEDSIGFDAELGVIALADGMGGHRSGEVASRLAVKIVLEGLGTEVPRIRREVSKNAPLPEVDLVVGRANDAIFDAAQGDVNYHGMGTTLVVALFHNNRITFGHVGDSRIYRFRADRLQLLTRDDSLVREEVEMGLIAASQARRSHNRNLVTRALGTEKGLVAHLREEEVLPGDILMLCSDGLNDLVDDADLELILSALKSNLPLAAHHMVQAAKDNGGYDNVSVVLARVLKPFPAGGGAGWLERLLSWFR